MNTGYQMRNLTDLHYRLFQASFLPSAYDRVVERIALLYSEAPRDNCTSRSASYNWIPPLHGLD